MQFYERSPRPRWHYSSALFSCWHFGTRRNVGISRQKGLLFFAGPASCFFTSSGVCFFMFFLLESLLCVLEHAHSRSFARGLRRPRRGGFFVRVVSSSVALELLYLK